ncbi:MAG: flagellar hook capping FlgD N-terminal domain-containing protein [Polaromonas sp.]|nr:flagellar hook capping FlgD N-terminal domain-containing protein [Polaromonas sp.]
MATTTAATASLPSGILKYEDVIAKPKATSTGASQQDFLKLFTTQLQNQNPLDPTKNEAFVAQLAQFSQLEATTNMATQLTTFVTSMAGDRMLSGAAMIGKKVAVDGAPVVMSGGQPVQGVIALPAGAEGMRLEIFDSQGTLVRQQIAGAQTPGEVTLTWDGKDSLGSTVADGSYAFKATITSAGKTSNPPVTTLATVRSISQADAASPLMLQVDGGLSVALSDVKRVGN